MPDREKVIAALECLTVVNEAYLSTDCRERGCPYVTMDCEIAAEQDALRLLEAQEPVEPTTASANEPDDHKSWWYACGACQYPINRGDKYCRHCGRGVRWE